MSTNRPATANEQHLLRVAEQIEEHLGTFRQGMDDFRARISDLEQKAKSPEAHEVEDLSQEFAVLDAAMTDMEKVASTLRGAATNSGGGPVDANVGQPPLPTSPGGTGTPETGPSGGSQPAAGTPLQEPSGPSESPGAPSQPISTTQAGEGGQDASIGKPPTEGDFGEGQGV